MSSVIFVMNEISVYFLVGLFAVAVRGCLPPGANVFVAAPTPACRSGETRNLPGDQWSHCQC